MMPSIVTTPSVSIVALRSDYRLQVETHHSWDHHGHSLFSHSGGKKKKRRLTKKEKVLAVLDYLPMSS